VSAVERVTLTVAGTDAEGREIGVDPSVLDRLGTTDGASLTVRGDRATVGRARGVERDPRTAVLGGTLARDAGVRVGDPVTLAAADVRPAESVTLAPVPDLSIRGDGSAVRAALRGRPLSVDDRCTVSLFDGSLDLPLCVLATVPGAPVRVTAATAVDLRDGPADPADDRAREPHVPDETVGGYGETRGALGRAVVAPLIDADAFDARGGRPGTGLLLAGPSGVGKTHLLSHAAWRADAAMVRVDPARLLADGRADLATHLDEARAAADRVDRAVVNLDGIDRATAADGRGERVSAQVCRAIDRLRGTEGVVIAGEARDAAAVPDALRRGDRLATTVTVPPPDREDRTEVLAAVTRGLRIEEGWSPAAVARRAFGFLAADLVALRSRAIAEAVDRGAAPPTVTAADFEAALSATDPASMRGVGVETPAVTFEDVGGLADVERELVRAVEWPLRYPEAFAALGVAAPDGVLLYGPPGTGKTLLARAVASTTDANFVPVDGPELLDKYVGESERAVRDLFERARANAPAVVFLDEVDALAPARRGETSGAAAPERVVSQLLTELDGIEPRGGVTVIGATNRPDRLDPALLRPGRLDRLLAVPLPDEAARREIFRVHARDRPVGAVDYDALARRTEGYSGSDVAAIVREAGLLAIEERLDDGTTPDPDAFDALRIEERHLDRAVESVSPSVSGERREYHEGVERRLGRER
jgi:transitional endoplasmic reticulum ATPase